MTGRKRFLAACQGKAVDRTPIWIMRQAGRYLPEYRALRSQHSMDTALRNPAIAAEITLLPLKHFLLDAAIIFSDILPPLTAMGLDLAFVPGRGPQIGNPLRTTKAVDLLGVPPAEEAMGPTLEAIKIVRRELDARNLALIGFAGAPFTMASYAIEGGATRTFAHTKAFMYSEPAAWDRLMVKLSGMTIDYLNAQIAAGVDCVQLFDSWAGALSRYDYERYVKPYSYRVLSAVENSTAVIHFSTNTGTYLDAVADAGGHVIGVDWRTPIDEASARLQKPVMGNLDPAALLAPWRELMPQAQEVMQRMEGQPGHVFNLGHGILPNTPVENVQRLVDYVHSYHNG